MAIYRFSLQVISRGVGRSAVAAAAYRAGERIFDARTGLKHDFRARGAIEGGGLIGWSGTRESLWNAAEQAERHPRATVARELVLTVPRELDRQLRRALIVGYAEAISHRHSVAVDWSIHTPLASDGEAQPHAHLLMTTRRVDGGGRLAGKTRELDTRPSGPKHVEEWRALWAEHANAALRQAGLAVSLDHRSARRQGLQHEPQEHLGPAAAAMERRGVRTRKGDRNRRRRQRNRERVALEMEAGAICAAIAGLATEDPATTALPMVDRALAEVGRRPGAMAEALAAAQPWGDHAPVILAARVARLGRDARWQAMAACRQLGGTLANLLLDELATDDQPHRQRVR